MDIECGSPVRYEVKEIERKTRTYHNFTDIEAIDFETCEQCFKPLEHDKCSKCATDGSERLTGVFEVMDVSEQDYGLRLILQQNDILVTYLMWMLLPFYQDSVGLKVGSKVNVIGWRTSNRITNFRKFSKVRAI